MTLNSEPGTLSTTGCGPSKQTNKNQGERKKYKENAMKRSGGWGIGRGEEGAELC